MVGEGEGVSVGETVSGDSCNDAILSNVTVDVGNSTEEPVVVALSESIDG